MCVYSVYAHACVGLNEGRWLRETGQEWENGKGILDIDRREAPQMGKYANLHLTKHVILISSRPSSSSFCSISHCAIEHFLPTCGPIGRPESNPSSNPLLDVCLRLGDNTIEENQMFFHVNVTTSQATWTSRCFPKTPFHVPPVCFFILSTSSFLFELWLIHSRHEAVEIGLSTIRIRIGG